MVDVGVNGIGERGRLAWLIATIIAIVVLPAIALQKLTDSATAAVELVAHTNLVHAQVYQVVSQARSLEAATYALATGNDTPAIRGRLARSAEELGPSLDKLARLTSDNASQQVRVGRLGANINQRIALAQDVAEAADAQDSSDRRERLQRDVHDLATRYAIQPIAEAISREEGELLHDRSEDADRLQQQAHQLRAGAAIGQLLVLILIALFWLRQLRARVTAEHGQRQADQRARYVLQSVREPIVLVDANQHVLMHNAAFSELYGDGEDELPGKPLSEIGDGAWENPALLQRVHDVLQRNRELWDYEQVQSTPDGRERTMLINARQMPLPDSDDRVILITVSDITARKANEDHISDLNEQLQGKIEQVSEVNHELEAFSYSVSHDLRAPLRHIAGFADKLRRHLGDDADDKSTHYLDVMRKSAQRMSALIDDLLVYSRLGRSAMRLQAIDMQSVVDEVRSMLDSNVLSDHPKHRIDWHVAPLPILVADENMMRQLWLNLLGNAVKYSMRREPAKIEVEYRRLDDGSHQFTVRDNGVGFDMNYADKLFGVFQRMHKASDYAGTGIGLASVRRILLRHGGRIEAEAAPDAGATFRFVLPASLDSPKSLTGPTE